MSTFTVDELNGILAQHQLWLDTRWDNEVRGVRANLIRADLSDANLSGANLSGAYLREGVRWETYVSEVVPMNAQRTNARDRARRMLPIVESNLKSGLIYGRPMTHEERKILTNLQKEYTETLQGRTTKAAHA